ncbi:MAG: tRNA lysidine(34) synthetase TilS [Desulfobacterales bacterium]|nr:MAG: tRNA lysidine(34) synthetase TilS [Desulfobacterales bacterium]
MTRTPIEQKFLDTVAEMGSAFCGKTMIVAVSGGPDSTALLTLMTKFFPDQVQAAAYINHNLRPKETGAEIKHVHTLCRLYHIDFIYESVNVPQEKQARGESTEECCRRLRYQALRKICSDRSVSCIATGHTSNDQIEEFLIRIIRGSGLKGISGMPLVNKDIVRPLLRISKPEIISYLTAEKISYCTDSTNLSRNFLRNRIRLDLVPRLEELNPSIAGTIENMCRIFQAEDRFLEKKTNRFYKKVVKTSSQQQQALLIPLFTTAEPAIQRRIVEKLCWKSGIRPTCKSIENICALALQGRTGSSLHVSADITVRKTPDQLLFHPATRSGSRQKRSGPEWSGQIVIPGPGSYRVTEINRQLVITEACRPARCDQDDILFIDRDQISFPLMLRTALPGERFKPLGAAGRKKVNRFMSDRKIPQYQRYTHPVLLSEGRIVSIIGIAIDDSVKITEKTKNCVALRWNHIDQ